ncbi:MAG: hypothetical protein EHM58_02580 [Ignavibacteriae bacterium]|nr:MAG: hypothetical protein EHM58_02580 [Ignavibacteriota bacterium]
MSKEFLNFAEISKAVLFQDLLDILNIPYKQKKGELHGDGFIVNIDKNLFFMPKNDAVKGSPINFLAYYRNLDLRTAAEELKNHFLKKEKEPKREIPNLTLEWHEYIVKRGISREIAQEYEVGYVKQRSVIAGRIAFKIYDHTGKHIGYIGYKPEDDSWFYPKGFKRPLFGVYRLKETKYVIVTVDPFDALKIASLGLRQVVSLLANSMTSEQEEQLKRFKYILLFHKEPENIVNRLCKTSFIKAPELSKSLKELTDQKLLNMIKPS